MKDFKGLEIGQKASVKRIFTKRDLIERATLIGDENPVFSDQKYLDDSQFRDLIVPGDLLGSMISYLLGTKLPGPGTGWLKQKFRFPNPAYVNEEITAEVKITRIRHEKDLVNLNTYCTNPSGETVCKGEALVLIKDLQKS